MSTEIGPRDLSIISRSLRRSACFLLLVGPGSVALAGGGWVPDAGEGTLQLGWSRKTAHTSWDVSGNTFANTGRFENHDFRYTYLSGEVGVSEDLSATFVVTYLDGLEGPTGDLERNSGMSDAWFGLRYGLRQDRRVPMALALTLRTPVFYDESGPYDRHVYDEDGNVVGQSSEWRGLLKHDLTLSYSLGRSFANSGWTSAGIGYTWRQGAPADEIPLHAELGWPTPWEPAMVKIAVDSVHALGNDSARRPDDRFGARDTFNFNDASMARLSGSIIVSLGAARRWNVETGYGVWVWGRSARQYEEPFLALGRSF